VLTWCAICRVWRYVRALDQDTLDPRMIGVKKVMGGGMRDSFLVDGRGPALTQP